MKKNNSLVTKFIRAGIICVFITGLFLAVASDRTNEWLARNVANRIYTDTFLLGKVIASHPEGAMPPDAGTGSLVYAPEDLTIELLSGPDQGATIHLQNRVNPQLAEPDKIVVLTRDLETNSFYYYLADRFRLAPLLAIILLFIMVVIVFGKLRGFTSLLGLGLSALVLIAFIIPAVLSGGNPTGTIFAGVLCIAVISLYLAHGFRSHTTIAVIATLLALALSFGLALLFSFLAGLTPGTSEDTAFIGSFISSLDLGAVLLGGILIGTLGVLNDITIIQSVTIEEIAKADPGLGFAELFRRGAKVGREHIGTLVNTLVLVYAGASFPLLLTFVINRVTNPYLVVFNGEPIAEEIVRTVVGSLGLILAVPITTFLASYYYGKLKGKPASIRND